MTGKIFISYRRDDSEGYAGRIYDRLGSHFGYENIFMDVDMIEPGTDFVDAINNAIETSDAVMILIGKRWLNAVDAQGNRRLDKPQDFVRLEVASALRRDIRVIPVLVGESVMPSPGNLPEDISGLTRRNAIEITHARFNTDMNKLIRALESAIKYSEGLRKQAKKQEKPPKVKKAAASKIVTAEKKKTPSKQKLDQEKKEKQLPRPEGDKVGISWLLTKSVIYLAVFWAVAWIGDVLAIELSDGNANVLRYQEMWTLNGWVMRTVIGWVLVTSVVLAFPRRDYWDFTVRIGLAGVLGGILYAGVTWLFTDGPFGMQLEWVSPFPIEFGILILILVGYYFGPLAGFFCGVIGSMLIEAFRLTGVFPHWMIGFGIIGLLPGLWQEISKNSKWRHGMVWGAVILMALGGIPGIFYFADWAHVDFRGESRVCAPSCGWTIYFAVVLLLVVNYWGKINEKFRTPAVLAASGVALGMNYAILTEGFWQDGFYVFANLGALYSGGFSPSLGSSAIIGIVGAILWLWGETKLNPS